MKGDLHPRAAIVIIASCRTWNKKVGERRATMTREQNCVRDVATKRTQNRNQKRRREKTTCARGISATPTNYKNETEE
jgi:hypothetical protein